MPGNFTFRIVSDNTVLTYSELVMFQGAAVVFSVSPLSSPSHSKVPFSFFGVGFLKCFHIKCVLDRISRDPVSLHDSTMMCEFPFFADSQIQVHCNGNQIFAEKIRLRVDVSIVRLRPSMILSKLPYLITLFGSKFLQTDVCLYSNVTLTTFCVNSSMLVCSFPKIDFAIPTLR